MADDINATTLDIQDRLDTALGNEKDVIKRKFASEIKEIDGLIAKAQAYGNSQLVTKLQKSMSDLKKAQDLEIKAQKDANDKQAIIDATTTTKQQPSFSSVPTNATTQTQPRIITAANSSDIVILQLQVGNSTFDAQVKRSIVNELMNEIKRLQSVGG